MNLVFMNSLEKEMEPGRYRTAAVSIVEEKGKHQIHWREPDDQGRSRTDMWYEGDNWEEMLVTFQFRLTEKMAEGYMPVIERLPMRPDQLSASAKLIQMLYYYSEQHSNEELYQSLRTWRRERSSKEGKAPFIVASNRLLRLIATFVPHTRDELLLLPGFGQNKLDWYGDEILVITQKVKQERSFPLAWVADQIKEEEFLAWLYTQKELKYKAEAEQMARKKQLLQWVHEGHALSQLEAQTGQSARDIVMLIERLDQEGYDLSPWIEQELSEVDAGERDHVMKAFAKQGDKYLKPILETVYTADQQQAEADKFYTRLRLLRMLHRKAIETPVTAEQAG